MAEGVSADTERMHGLFALSRDLFGIADAQGYFQDVNPAWEPQLGWTRRELRARSFLEFIHPDDQAPTIAQCEEQEGGGHAISVSNRYRHRDGTYRWQERNAPLVGDAPPDPSARSVPKPWTVDELVRAMRELLDVCSGATAVVAAA